MKFKISFRHLNQNYELNVQLINCDKKIERWKVWHNALSVVFENNRPYYLGHIGLRKRRPIWKIIDYKFEPHLYINSAMDRESFSNYVINLIDQKVEEIRKKNS